MLVKYKSFVISSIGFMLSFVVLPNHTMAQFFEPGVIELEAGASVGMMNCLTDLGGKPGAGKKFTKDFDGSNSQLCYGIYGVATYENKIALRAEVAIGKVSADDNKEGLLIKVPADFLDVRKNRNLRFQSKITEISLLAEVHPLGFMNAFIDDEGNGPIVSPYLLGGIGYFSFNPQAPNPSGQLVDLQPLSTEGQGILPDRPVYNLKQINIPMGIGVKFNISPAIKIRTELVYRKLFTDYLDDVSTTYVDKGIYANSSLTEIQKINAPKMAWRTLWTPPSENSSAEYKDLYKKNAPQIGGKRGNPDDKDSFFSFNLKIGVSLSALGLTGSY